MFFSNRVEVRQKGIRKKFAYNFIKIIMEQFILRNSRTKFFFKNVILAALVKQNLRKTTESIAKNRSKELSMKSNKV